jgi:hypothetical protein
VLELAELELHGGVPALDHGVVQRRAGSTHGLLDADPATGSPEVLGDVLTALIGVHDHLAQGGLAATDRDRHLQSRLGQVGVVMLARLNPTIRREPMYKTEST